MTKRITRSARVRRQKPAGRPRKGLRPGERVRDYPTVTVRLPPDARVLLKALCTHLDLPLWQAIRHLTICFVRALPPSQRRAVLNRARSEAKRGRSR